MVYVGYIRNPGASIHLGVRFFGAPWNESSSVLGSHYGTPG